MLSHKGDIYSNELANKGGSLPELPAGDVDPCWSGFAAAYCELELAAPYQELVRTMMELLAPHEGERWLDAGCGSGVMTELLLRSTNGRVFVDAVDFSRIMLRHMRVRMSHPIRLGQVRIHHLDLRNPLPFPDDSYQGIVANLVLPYIDTFQGVYTGLQALVKGSILGIPRLWSVVLLHRFRSQTASGAA
jgi:SAM-dependent methyltransferase